MSCEIHIAIKSQALDATALERRAELRGVGGVCVFKGIIRPDEQGRIIEEMEYEQYEGMAESEMRRLAEAAARRWPILSVAAEHRVGAVPVGEPAVVVAVGAGHRDEAFEACRFLIDAIKQTVPIWKTSEVGPGHSEATPAGRERLKGEA